MNMSRSRHASDPSERRHLYKLRTLGMTEHLRMIVMAIVIGLLCGFGAIVLRWSIRGVQLLFFSQDHPTVPMLASLPWYAKVFLPAAGGLIVGMIIHYFSREVKGHGVPEVIEALVRRGGIIRVRTVVAKIAASAVCIGSGGSTGREGPIVQIGSAIGSVMGQVCKISGSKMRTLVGCGAASGIAAAFNAPIAGSLFALEVVLGDFTVSRFSPIVISSVTSTIVSRYYYGNYPAFEVPHYELVSAYEMIPYTLLGLLSGLAAILFIRILYLSEDLFESLPVPIPIRATLGGLLMGTVAVWFPHVYGVGYETIDHILEGYMGGVLLLAIFLAKILATSFTLGSGGSGGIFAPSLFMGAALGGFVGSFAHMVVPGATAGLGAYALVGMGAMVSGTIHAPITSILIIFELTNDYSIILPLMTSCILATIVSSRLFPLSIYSFKLSRRGISLHQGRDVNIFRDLSVEDHMDDSPPTVRPGDSFDMVTNYFFAGHHSRVFVTDEDGRLSGVVSFEHLRQVLPEWQNLTDILVADDVMVPAQAILRPGDTLARAMHIFARTGEDELPVLDQEGRLAGCLSKSHAIGSYNREMLKRDLAFEIQEGVNQASAAHQYHFGDDFVLSSLPVPPPFVGKVLKDLQVRTRYNVEVVLIRSSEGTTVFPDASYRFAPGDQICVVGKDPLVQALRNL